MTIHKNSFSSISTIVLLLIAGLFIRFWLAQLKPLWLDEQYSLFYAADLNNLKLFTESHLPTYYYLLSFVQPITTNFSLLRTITSIFPAFLGILLIVGHFFLTKKTSFFALAAATCLLSFSPLNIETSWQLRMYGLISLGACLQYLGLSYHLTKKTTKSLLVLLLFLIVINVIDYPLLISGLFVITYAAVTQNMSWKNNLLTICSYGVISLGQIWLSFGTLNIKHQLEYSYSWIPQPSLVRGTEMTLAILGIKISNPTMLITLLILAAASGIALLFLAIRKKLSPMAIFKQELVGLFFFSILSLLGFSLLLPFLANRFFFYHFVPAVSLFLPRILLPFSLFFCIALAKQKNKFSKMTAFLLITYYLFQNISTLNELQNKPYIPDNLPKNLELMSKESVVFFPSWETLESIQSANLTNINRTTEIMLNSEKIEQKFYTVHDAENPNAICLDLKNRVVIIKAVQNEYLYQSNLDFISAVNSCCNDPKKDGLYLYYYCGNQN